MIVNLRMVLSSGDQGCVQDHHHGLFQSQLDNVIVVWCNNSVYGPTDGEARYILCSPQQASVSVSVDRKLIYIFLQSDHQNVKVL